MTSMAGLRVTKAVMATAGATVGGGDGTDVDPPTDPQPPAMPLTAPAGWVRQADTEFNIDVAEGNMLLAGSGYSGLPSADDRGRMQFGAYTYPGYKDTRSNPSHSKAITIGATNGSTTITSAGLFTAANFFYPGTGAFGGSYVSLSGIFPSGTRIISITNTSSAVVSKACIGATGSYVATAKSDFGYYDEKGYSVANGKLRLHVHTIAATGEHHVGALRPKLNNGTGVWNVPSGAFEYCMRVPVPIPTYKMAPLLWPASNTSSNGGEIDFPETDLNGTDTITAFTHFQDNSGQYSNSSAVIDVVDTAWHTYRIEWRPYGGPGGADATLTTVKYFCDGVQVGSTRTGVNVPHDPMHWVWQVETDLRYTSAIDDTADGYVEYAWALFDNAV